MIASDNARQAADGGRGGDGGADEMQKKASEETLLGRHRETAATLSFTEGLIVAVQNHHFCVLVLAGGLLAGVGSAWQSLLQKILKPVGLR